MFKKLSSFVFAVAFLASGWSTVMAGALCPHEECMGRPAAVVHHGEHEVEAPAEEGCSKGVELAGHESHEPAGEAITGQHSSHLFRGSGGHSGSCIHCVGAPSTPVRSGFVSEPSQARRDAARQAEPPAVSGVIPSVAAFPALRPTQGSPPSTSQRRHLLINVFLI